MSDASFTANRIRTIREKLDITQREFAILLSVEQPTIARWESKRNSKPLSREATKRLEFYEHASAEEIATIKQTLAKQGGEFALAAIASAFAAIPTGTIGCSAYGLSLIGATMNLLRKAFDPQPQLQPSQELAPDSTKASKKGRRPSRRRKPRRSDQS
ncbi:MAG: hypothetical protein JSS27_18385 [Planctomycetes bacterium]|nr:hypothetical protein [Planctomycetota bacterium]